MTRSPRLFTLIATLGLAMTATACLADEPSEDDIDDALDASELDDGKADGSSSRHYLLWHRPGVELYFAAFGRAGGGRLRCPDGEVREYCEIEGSDLRLGPAVAGAGEQGASDLVIDELNDRSMIARGRLIREGDRVYLHATALTRSITEVMPQAPCYRIRPVTTEGNCPAGSEPFCYINNFEKLDTPIVRKVQHIYLDDADPTPDFWGQPTPLVQKKIDDGLLAARTRPVYTCGGMENRGTEASPDLWFWGMQLFVPGQ